MFRIKVVHKYSPQGEEQQLEKFEPRLLKTEKFRLKLDFPKCDAETFT